MASMGRTPKPPGWGSEPTDPTPPVRATSFHLAEQEYVVVVLPTRAATLLSAAETQVATLILEGMSNAQIAKARRTSGRTVADQIAGIFRKAGIGSRAELVAWLTEGARRAGDDGRAD